MTNDEILNWVINEGIKLPSKDTRVIINFNEDYDVQICNLNVVGRKNEWLVTFQTDFPEGDIQIWNSFVIDVDKRIIELT